MRKEPKYRLFLYKNLNIEGTKRPYFTMKLVDETSQDWIELGAFWKAQSGKGYSGFLNDGIELDTSGYVPYEKGGTTSDSPKIEDYD